MILVVVEKFESAILQGKKKNYLIVKKRTSTILRD